jgi:hypothetical protein
VWARIINAALTPGSVIIINRLAGLSAHAIILAI